MARAVHNLQLFEKLQSHIQEISKTNKEQYERIILSARAVHQYAQTDLDFTTIIAYFAKVSLLALWEVLLTDHIHSFRL